MNRWVRAAGAAALLVGLGLAVPARAQTTGTAGASGTTTFGDGDFFIGIQHQEGVNLADFDRSRFFNKAMCDCDEPVYIYVALTASGFAKRAAALAQTGTIEFLVGSMCNVNLYKQNCLSLKSQQISTFMSNGRDTVQTDARTLSSITVTSATVDGGVIVPTGVFTKTLDCTSPTNGFDQPIFVNIDYGSDGMIDGGTSTSVHIDLTPPVAPDHINVAPGNQALNVTWSPVDFTTNMDLQGYQILCRREANTQVFKDNTFGAYYKSCAKTRMGSGIEGLDPLFACSPLLNRSTSSYRVKILENDIWYAASVVSIDISGNASQPVLNGFDPTFMNPTNFAQPAPTVSFYQAYRAGDGTGGAGAPTSPPGQASGGFCAIATPAPRRPWAVAVALAGALAFVGMRRRRRR